MFKYLLLIVFAGSSLTACHTSPKVAQQQSTTTQPSDSVKQQPRVITADRLIVPGIGIGHIKLNENIDSVIQQLGKPDAGDAAMGKAVHIWFANHNASGHQLAVYCERQMATADETSRVKQIRITSPWYTTQDSIHIGSTIKALSDTYAIQKIALGTVENQHFEVYDTSQGLQFEVNKSGECSAIIVRNKHDKQSNMYIPFYSALKPY